MVFLSDVSKPISLPLRKFSFATSSTMHAKALWEHLPERTNLFAIFDVSAAKMVDLPDIPKTMKVLRGGEVVELVNLEQLLLQSREDMERLDSQEGLERYRQVIVIVSEPMIAIRYQLANGQVRRIQMNFLVSSDFGTAVDHLSSMGLPIKQADTSKLQKASLTSMQAVGESQLPPSENGPKASRSRLEGRFRLENAPMSSRGVCSKEVGISRESIRIEERNSALPDVDASQSQDCNHRFVSMIGRIADGSSRPTAFFPQPHLSTPPEILSTYGQDEDIPARDVKFTSSGPAASCSTAEGMRVALSQPDLRGLAKEVSLCRVICSSDRRLTRSSKSASSGQLGSEAKPGGLDIPACFESSSSSQVKRNRRSNPQPQSTRSAENVEDRPLSSGMMPPKRNLPFPPRSFMSQSNEETRDAGNVVPGRKWSKPAKQLSRHSTKQSSKTLHLSSSLPSTISSKVSKQSRKSITFHSSAPELPRRATAVSPITEESEVEEVSNLAFQRRVLEPRESHHLEANSRYEVPRINQHMASSTYPVQIIQAISAELGMEENWLRAAEAVIRGYQTQTPMASGKKTLLNLTGSKEQAEALLPALLHLDESWRRQVISHMTEYGFGVDQYDASGSSIASFMTAQTTETTKRFMDQLLANDPFQALCDEIQVEYERRKAR